MTAPAKARPATGTKAGTKAGTKTGTRAGTGVGARTGASTAAAGATPTQQRPARPAVPPRPVRWLVGPVPRRAPRTPFVLLIIGLLAFGLVGLLLLNTATASSSFRERSLQDRNNALTLRQQALQREVSAMDAPQALAKAAAGLGMVPGPDPAFLELLKNGSSKVIGDLSATVAPVPPPPPPTPAATPTPTPTPSHKATDPPTHGTASSPAHHTTASQHQQAHGSHR